MSRRRSVEVLHRVRDRAAETSIARSIAAAVGAWGPALHQPARALDTAVIATAVTQRRRVPFVGREAELRALDELLCGDTQVICLHGIAGMGKSGLLRAFVQRAHEGGATVFRLDCRADRADRAWVSCTSSSAPRSAGPPTTSQGVPRAPGAASSSRVVVALEQL